MDDTSAFNVPPKDNPYYPMDAYQYHAAEMYLNIFPDDITFYDLYHMLWEDEVPSDVEIIPWLDYAGHTKRELADDIYFAHRMLVTNFIAKE